MSEGHMALMIPIIALLIPFWAIYWGTRSSRAKQDEQREARKTFERLAREKLEVMKTAIAMGYSDSELQALDARLEKLVGTDKLRKLLDEKPRVPSVDADLLDTDLTSEMERIERAREKARRRQEQGG